MSEFRSYSGQEFFSTRFPPRKFLVENILKEKDSVIVVGGPKTGKSILLFQLICSLTSQHPFLDKYGVSKPCSVCYIQLEGEIEDYQDRLFRMSKAIEIHPENLHYKFSGPMNLLDRSEARLLCQEIAKYHPKLDVLIIDPLYFAFRGSLSDDAIVREFTGNLRIIKDYFGCAIIIVHHTHKVRIDPISGFVVDEGDDALFGSIFWKAWPDHILLLGNNPKTGVRSLTCSTQRSGAILASTSLRLVQPDPLYFEVSEATPNNSLKSLELLEYLKRVGPQNYNQIQSGMGIASSTFFYSIKPLIMQKLVTKDTSVRPMLYLAS